MLEESLASEPKGAPLTLAGSVEHDAGLQRITDGDSARSGYLICYAAPGERGERLQSNFVAIDDRTFFTIEARCQHPKDVLDDTSVASATAAVEQATFATGNDGYGHYWAKVFPSSV